MLERVSTGSLFHSTECRLTEAFVLSNSANKICITEAMEFIEKQSGGALTFNNFAATLSKLYSSGSGLPKDVVCNNCNKASYNILKGAKLITPEITANLTGQCGASFDDGQNPNDVTKFASNASPSSSSNAVMATTPLFTGGTFAALAVSMLTVLLSGFALLA